jgi:thiol:disulfide interchange protein DsbC
MMLKKVCGMLIAGLLAGNAWADESSLKKTIESTYPKVRVQSVTKTPFNGLYEVFLDGQIIYTDEKFSYLITDGRLIDPKNRRDLTSERMDELTRVDFGSLPLAQAVKVVKGNGSRKMAVFSDPDCPYCKKLEKELIGVNDVTIYTFLYPLDGLHPDAANKSRAIWCAPDRSKAWQEWILNGQLPKGVASCDAPIKEVAELGRKLGISSTPTLIFADGKRLLGAYPSKDIENALNAPMRK